MSFEKPRRRMIEVDSLQERLSPQDVAAFYGFQGEFSASTGGEMRGCCPCTDCDGHEDPRSISINLSGVKLWKCHRGNYGCSAQGKLLELAYCMKHGKIPAGKLTGQEFYAIAQDLETIAGDGHAETTKPIEHSPTPTEQRITVTQQKTRHKTEKTLAQTPNIPLAKSDNENTRKLDTLDNKLTVKLENLPPNASSYARHRAFLLSEELAAECRFGYLSSKEKSMVRGKWVYGVMDEQGQALAWIGRNTNYEHNQEVTPNAEESKYKFPRAEYFRRGLELYGQEWLNEDRFADSLQQHGVLLVEGFTDRIRLHQLDVASVAMMSNQLTDAQTQKLIEYAHKYGHGRVGVMHDADEKGDEGAKESLWRLHKGGVDAYLVWSREKFEGRYADRQPESLSEEEWNQVITVGRL